MPDAPELYMKKPTPSLPNHNATCMYNIELYNIYLYVKKS